MKPLEQAYGYQALKALILFLNIPVDYSTFLLASGQRSYGDLKMLNHDTEISPYVLSRFKNYGIIRTASNRVIESSKISLPKHQANILKARGHRVFNAEALDDTELIEVMRKGKFKSSIKEERVVVLSDEQIMLESEVISFVNPNSTIKIFVEDTNNGFVFRSSCGVIIKESKGKTTSTRLLETALIEGPQNLYYRSVFKNFCDTSNHSSLRGFMTPIESMVTKAVRLQFPNITRKCMDNIPTAALTLYHPRVFQKQLIRPKKLEFIYQ